MSKLPANVLAHGVDQPLPDPQLGGDPRLFSVGPLKVLYAAGDLRYFRLDHHEIHRRIYVAVRDHNWGTVPATLTDVRIAEDKSGFTCSYQAEHTRGDIHFAWTGTLVGKNNALSTNDEIDCTVQFAMEGVALSTFMSNRIGICVLHPVKECASQPCAVEHVDGSIEAGTFPQAISPHQPFKNIRVILHEAAPNLRAEVRFDGDIFEMEDQRNWSDASFKTYSRPLDLPMPFRVEAGTRIRQTVTVHVRGQHTPSQPQSAPQWSISMSGPAKPLPKIGLQIASHKQPLTVKEISRLRALNLSHLRVELRLAEESYEAQLQRAVAESKALNVPLEIALFIPDPANLHLRQLAALLERHAPDICRWIVLPARGQATPAGLIDLARLYLKRHALNASFGGGTDANFTELNRNRSAIVGADFATFSMNPQVHAEDDLSIIENLPSAAEVVCSAKPLAPSLPIVVSPVTLKPRYVAAATGPDVAGSANELPKEVDVRQMSLLGAAWTLASLKHLAEAGAYSITYYETTGWRGVMETEAGSSLPGAFRSWPGCVYPLYHVFADVGEFMGGDLLAFECADCVNESALVLRRDNRMRVLLTNPNPDWRGVTFRDVPGGWRLVSTLALNNTNVEQAMRSPEDFRASRQNIEILSEFRLPPYSVLRVDLEKGND